MNKQLLSRIDSFIDSLGQQNMSDQQEAVLLTADLHNIGGKNDKCTNYTEKVKPETTAVQTMMSAQVATTADAATGQSLTPNATNRP